MMPVTRQMHLGMFYLGTGGHVAGWRHPGADTDFHDAAAIQNVARICERGKLDFIFIGDNLYANLKEHPSYTARLDPLITLTAMAAVTKHVGLASTASTTYSDPFTVARNFASLDHISGGRAAWNLVTSGSPEAGPNFGQVHPNHAERYEVAAEFAEVVFGLWDCWDDDAIVADRASGKYIDPSRVRVLNHQGKHFSVRGPLNMARCPQGHPVILQAAGSDVGLTLAARTADIIFTVTQDFEGSRSAYRDLKDRIAKAGRSKDEVKILPGVMPVVGRTDKEALEKLNQLQSYVDSSNAVGMLSNRLGVDMSAYPLDGPVPDLPDTEGYKGFTAVMLAKAKRENMTLRDLYNLTAAARGHWTLCGSPETIADTFATWVEEGAADGFNIMPAYFPGALEEFVDLVVPILQERGLYRRDYEGTMLRDHLGLQRPSARR